MSADALVSINFFHSAHDVRASLFDELMCFVIALIQNSSFHVRERELKHVGEIDALSRSALPWADGMREAAQEISADMSGDLEVTRGRGWLEAGVENRFSRVPTNEDQDVAPIELGTVSFGDPKRMSGAIRT